LRRVLVLLVLLGLFGMPLAVYQQWLDVPARWNPGTP
jgi:hypothetical protein